MNLAEAQSKPVSHGLDPDEAGMMSSVRIRNLRPADEHARIAGRMVVEIRPLDSSLGDRACLALAIALGAPAYTADGSWKGLSRHSHIHYVC